MVVKSKKHIVDLDMTIAQRGIGRLMQYTGSGIIPEGQCTIVVKKSSEGVSVSEDSSDV